MAEGILLAVAGALLITPGFITDGVGFILLLPPGRAVIAGWMLSRVTLVSPTFDGTFHAGSSGSFENGVDAIEGEFERHSEGDDRPPSG